MASKAKIVNAVEGAIDAAKNAVKDSDVVKKVESAFGAADPAEVAKYRGKSRQMEISNSAANESEAGDAITTGAVPHPEADAKKVQDLEFKEDVKVPGQKAEAEAADVAKAEVPAVGKPERKKNVKTNYFDTEPKKNPNGSVVQAGEGFTDAARHMEGKTFEQALPNIKSALTSQLKEAGLPMNADGLAQHLKDSWKASDKHAKALITSLKKNDPELFESTVEAAAKDEEAAGVPGFFSKAWDAIKKGGLKSVLALTAAGTIAHDALEGDDGYEKKPETKEQPKGSFDPKTGVSTVPVTKSSAPAQSAKEGPATKEEIASHLQKLQTEHPGLNVKTSIMDYMKARGLSGSFDERAKIAAENGISGYKGTAAQNIDLARRIKEKYGKSEGNLPETIVL